MPADYVINSEEQSCENHNISVRAEIFLLSCIVFFKKKHNLFLKVFSGFGGSTQMQGTCEKERNKRLKI